MTDSAAARAYPPEPHDDGPDGMVVEAFPPAAHTHGLGAPTHPMVSPSRTAVLESQPPLGFPGESRLTGVSFGGDPRAAEPPAFGFNAPGAPPAPLQSGATQEESRTLSGRQAAPPDLFPAAAPFPQRGPQAPRELMPPVMTGARRQRLGDAPTPTFGPPGKDRSTPAMVLLSMLTLGLYTIVWHRRVNQEMGDFDPRIHVRPARTAWAIALPLLAGLLASAAAAAIVVTDHMGIALDIPVTARQAYLGLPAIVAVPYLVMLLPFSMVAVAMTAERVRVVEDHAGVTTDEQLRPAALVGWLLLPVLGGLVVMAREQRSLNRIWHLARW
jgi:hypothetical protein